VLPQGATTPSNAEIYTALQPSRQDGGGGTNFEAITRLRDGATWQEANAEINRAWSLRADRYELKDNPGAQVTYYSVPLQKGQAAPESSILQVGGSLFSVSDKSMRSERNRGVRREL
jgi:hypothetical protein